MKRIKTIKRAIIVITVMVVLFVLICVLPFLRRRPAQMREYVQSEGFYEESLEDVNINGICFHFLQVGDVANINDAFFDKYGSCTGVVVGDDETCIDIFEQYTGIGHTNQEYYGMRYYVDDAQCPVGAQLGCAFEYDTDDGDFSEDSIEVYISNELLEAYKGLLPEVEQADQGTIYSIYDNILYYMEGDENMNEFLMNVCTIVFQDGRYYYFYGAIDKKVKENYLNSYCSVLYNFLEQINN